MEGPRPAGVDVGLVERLKHLDEVGALPLEERRQQAALAIKASGGGEERFLHEDICGDSSGIIYHCTPPPDTTERSSRPYEEIKRHF